MREISATEAARGFSALLDAVEHHGETFVVTRGGRSIARIEAATGASGAAVKALLRRNRPDPTWADEVREVRAAASVATQRIVVTADVSAFRDLPGVHHRP